jgi:hypothetical protein
LAVLLGRIGRDWVAVKETAKIIPLGACAIGFGAYNAPFFRRGERLAQPLVELSGFVKT